MLVFALLVAGLVYPQITIALGSIHFVGRILYTLGYRVSAKARMIGAPFVMLSLMAMLVTVLVASAKLTGFVYNSKTIWSLQ